MRNSLLLFLRFHSPLALLALLLLAVPLLPAPLSDPNWHGLRSVFVEVGAALCLALLIGQVRVPQCWRCWLDALRTVPVRFLIALFLWGGLTAPFTQAKIFAAQGLLLLGAGLVVTLTVCTQARTRSQYQLLFDVLIATTLLVSLSGFAGYGLGGPNQQPLLVGFYYDHQLYGAVFVVLLPLMLSAAVSPATPLRRLFAQAALLCGTLALGLSEARSAWIGTSVAGMVFLWLVFWVRPAPIRQDEEVNARPHFSSRRLLLAAVPVLLVAGAAAFFLQTTPQITSVNQRLHTLTRLTTQSPGHGTESVAWRLHAWQGARRMVLTKPLWGWGVGTYPCFHSAFTHSGENTAKVLQRGPSLPDEAHNSYLQTAVEMGLPGLALWLGVLGCAFGSGLVALRRMTPGGVRQWSLMGCLSALAGQSVDALANPSWQFGEVGIFLWIALGLTLALALGVPHENSEVVCGRDTPGRRVGCYATAAAVLGGLVWVIFQTARVLPRPTL